MSKGEKIRILVVDDEPAMREVIRLILKDYDIVEASGGYEAIKRCDEKKPDLVLMDVMMPKMNGVEATNVILEKYPEIKVVAVTAYKTHKGKEMLGAGALEILEKPFRKADLQELVQRISNKEKITQEIY